MRELGEIRNNDCFTESKDGVRFDGLVLCGWLKLPGVKRMLSVVAGVGKAGNGITWEHVSVSFGGNNKIPDWDVMCKVKNIFWLPEEEVHQIHPKESKYLHGVGGLENVLHLWRPVNGWTEEV